MERIMKYINRVYRASVIDRDQAFKDDGLCGVHISYIRLICSQEGLTQDEISKFLFVNKSTVTRNLNKIEQKGFIYREVDSDDKRIKRVFPREKSKLLYHKIMAYLDDWNNKITGFIPHEEEDFVIKILKNLAKEATYAVEETKNNKEGR